MIRKNLEPITRLRYYGYLDAVHPVATIRVPYLSSLPEFVVSVCFSISIPVTVSSYNI